jgi:hypothetical protein
MPAPDDGFGLTMAGVRWGLLSTASIGAVVVAATHAELPFGRTDAVAQAGVLEAVLSSSGRGEPVTLPG